MFEKERGLLPLTTKRVGFAQPTPFVRNALQYVWASSNDQYQTCQAVRQRMCAVKCLGAPFRSNVPVKREPVPTVQQVCCIKLQPTKSLCVNYPAFPSCFGFNERKFMNFIKISSILPNFEAVVLLWNAIYSTSSKKAKTLVLVNRVWTRQMGFDSWSNQFIENRCICDRNQERNTIFWTTSGGCCFVVGVLPCYTTKIRTIFD